MNNRLPWRIGIGFDAHRLKKGRKLMLGGTEIPSAYGLAGHSDADVLLHALIDGLLGALALPDIGQQFPDTDPAFRNADSRQLLKTVLRMVRQKGYRLLQLDSTLVTDRPKLASHIPDIRQNLARLLKIPENRIGIKAKTTEGTRLALPEKSISALVTVLLRAVK
ncbi:MAG: 2-C-methyl-D-erythritol 2,4-cyclodiphosphate synthase [candidate division WOR-3 bacterium]|uniref:2-C-methyl-D-erythritol 2,4-cyclodiphosphate synthase n=1 Tax=candidate division WOR-3 bacterium TaxID=2052148 RepID=A0A7C1SCD3_UNCW3|nr:2-C-methyl-D-erythritol 2,4-cyclodiphosphate synthase [candidate division WOR-3 bacterium]